MWDKLYYTRHITYSHKKWCEIFVNFYCILNFIELNENWPK